MIRSRSYYINTMYIINMRTKSSFLCINVVIMFTFTGDPKKCTKLLILALFLISLGVGLVILAIWWKNRKGIIF